MESPKHDFLLLNVDYTAGSDDSGLQPLPTEE